MLDVRPNVEISLPHKSYLFKYCFKIFYDTNLSGNRNWVRVVYAFITEIFTKEVLLFRLDGRKCSVWRPGSPYKLETWHKNLYVYCW